MVGKNRGLQVCFEPGVAGAPSRLFTDDDDCFVWTFLCRFQTFLLKILGNVAFHHIGLLTALMEAENFGAYLDTNTGDITPTGVDCGAHCPYSSMWDLRSEHSGIVNSGIKEFSRVSKNP
jgi:hypothetical protein